MSVFTPSKVMTLREIRTLIIYKNTTIRRFAAKHGLNYQMISNDLNGGHQYKRFRETLREIYEIEFIVG